MCTTAFRHISHMNRPLAFDPDVALDRAMHLFWERGYEGTSLQDLLRATHLSKSSLYQTFGSKHALLLEAIRRYRDEISSRMDADLAAASSGRAFIEDVFSEFAESGCFVLNCASEFAQRDREVAELVSCGLARFEAIFEAAVRRAQQEGEIDHGRDAKALARYLVSSRSGLKTMAKAGASPRTMKDIVDAVLRTLFG
ncbi:MAG: TetR family transcriptional regulator [Bacteroidetes bacterium CG12_big_fil_rev_8_21_14_0_65_60_17]|nr:MAG: TetR family transcriptional regulator [Bacteroidetes bacterium CG12_big_fil_rev_8_21_14_0_65_60_17]